MVYLLTYYMRKMTLGFYQAQLKLTKLGGRQRKEAVYSLLTV